MPLAAKSALNHQLSDSENLDKIFVSFLMIYDIMILEIGQSARTAGMQNGAPALQAAENHGGTGPMKGQAPFFCAFRFRSMHSHGDLGIAKGMLRRGISRRYRNEIGGLY